MLNGASKAPIPISTLQSNPTPQRRQDLARLINYYRLVVETFETERIKNYELLQNIKISNEDQHKVDWEIKRRKDEIIELENALHEINMALNNERKKAIHYGKVIENCKSMAKEDKRRIKQLLELSEPIEQTIKLVQNKEPTKLEKYSNFNFEECLGDDNIVDSPDNVSITKAMKNTKIKGANKAKSSNKKMAVKSNYGQGYNPFEKKNQEIKYRIPPSDEKQNIIRTVLFPENEKTDELSSQNFELKKEIELIKELYEEKLKKIEENRLLKEERFRQQCIAYKTKADDLIKENQKLEKLNFATAKDYLELKYQNGIEEQKKHEELEKLKQENAILENQLKNIVKKSSQDKSRALKDYTKKTREISEHLGNQVRIEDQKTKIIRSQYEELQKKFEPSIKNLENKSKALINKCKFLEGRKMNEYIGYINEIELMRKRIRSFRDYAEKINKKTGGDLLIQDPEQEDDVQQDNNDEEEQQEIQGEEGDENENNIDADNNNDENIEEENNNDMDLENQEMS
jgi:hypothetical protein